MQTISGARRRACIIVAASFALAATPALAQDDTRVAAEIIGLAQAQIDATVARQPVTERMSAISNDYRPPRKIAPSQRDQNPIQGC